MTTKITGITSRTNFVDYKGLTDVKSLHDLYDMVKRSKQAEVVEKNDNINKTLLTKDVYGSSKSIFNTTLKFYHRVQEASIVDLLKELNAIESTAYFIPSQDKIKATYKKICEKIVVGLSGVIDPTEAMKTEKMDIYHNSTLDVTSFGLIKRYTVSVSLTKDVELKWNRDALLTEIGLKKNESIVGKIASNADTSVLGGGLSIVNKNANDIFFSVVDHYYNARSESIISDKEILKKKQKNISGYGSTLVDIDLNIKNEVTVYEQYAFDVFFELFTDMTKAKSQAEIVIPIQLSVERLIANWTVVGGDAFLEKVKTDLYKLLKLNFLEFFTNQNVLANSVYLKNLYGYEYKNVVSNPKARKDFNNRMAYLKYIFRKRRMLESIINDADSIIVNPSMEKVKAFTIKVGEYNNSTSHSKKLTASIPNITGVDLNGFLIESHRTIDTSKIDIDSLGNGTDFQISLIRWINTMPVLDPYKRLVSRNQKALDAIIRAHESVSFQDFEKNLTLLAKDVANTIEGFENEVNESLSKTDNMSKIISYRANLIQEFGLYYALFFDSQFALEAKDVNELLNNLKKYGLVDGFKYNIEVVLSALGYAEIKVKAKGEEFDVTRETYETLKSFFIAKLAENPPSNKFLNTISNFIDFQTQSIDITTLTFSKFFLVIKKILTSISPDIDGDKELLDSIAMYIEYNLEYNFNNSSLKKILTDILSLLGVGLALHVESLVDSVTNYESVIVRSVLLSLKNPVIYVSLINSFANMESYRKILDDNTIRIQTFKNNVMELDQKVIAGKKNRSLTSFFKINENSIDYAYAVLANRSDAVGIIGKKRRVFKKSLKKKKDVFNTDNKNQI